MAEPVDTQPGAPASDLDVSTEEADASTRLLTVRVPADRARRIRERERDELGGSINLDGFRPGQVPGRVVEERYGEVVDERVRRTGVEEALREVLEGADFRPVDRPEVTSVSYERDGELTFEARVEVAPAPELERTGGFLVERPSVEVDEQDVDEVLSRLRDDHAVWEPVERRPTDGDQVAVRIRPLDEAGEPTDDAGEDDEPYRFELGEGYAIDEVEDAIATLEPGGTGTFDVRFPDDFDDDDLAGATRTLRIELLEVKAKDAPAVGDELAAAVGDFATMDELRATIREDLESHREEEAEEEVRRSLLDSIIEANAFDVPEAMVERYLDRVVDAPEDADPEQVEQARRQFYPRAEQEVKRQMVLDRLMEREGFEATEDELDARVREIAESRDADPADVRRKLARQQQLDGVRRHIATEKLFEHLKEASEIR